MDGAARLRGRLGAACRAGRAADGDGHGLRAGAPSPWPRSRVRNFKQAIYRGFYLQPEAAKQFGVALDVTVEGMQDTIEGAKAFSEKRQPRYIDG